MTVRSRKQAGTSLVEVLVVIVVFLVGILAMLQVFPGGLRILSETRNNSLALNLARDEMARIEGQIEQLPEQILPIRPTYDATVITILDNLRAPGDLGPTSNFLAFDNVLQENVLQDIDGNSLIEWERGTGSNVFRRIIGEGRRIPLPRRVGGAGNFYGSLLTLQFAPTADIRQVYSNDMVRVPIATSEIAGIRAPRESEYYIEQNGFRLYLPADDTLQRFYRLSVSAFIDDGTSNVRKEFLSVEITANPDASGIYIEDLSAAPGVLLSAGETLLSINLESVRVARAFEEISTAGNFSADNPYEYMVIDPVLGYLLFNPIGYNYFEPRPNGKRLPLICKVDYDVLDWRIIREEFRITEDSSRQYKLALFNIKFKGQQEVDSQLYDGLGFLYPDGLGGFEEYEFFDDNPPSGEDMRRRAAVLLIDAESGGVILPESYEVSGSGLITFFSNQVTILEKQKGTLIPLRLPNQPLEGRSIRALYRANNEWSVQVLKASESYVEADNFPPVIGEYYVGGGAAGGSPTRIYFPRADIGMSVTIGEIWYDGSNIGEVLADQQFVIQATGNSDLPNLAYIDITERASDATGFNDTATGYIVRGVKGASVSVRVLWNSAPLIVRPDPTANVEELNRWGQNWRRNSTQTFIQQGEGL